MLLANPDAWLELVEPIRKVIQEGGLYVFFDGQVLPARPGPVKFNGLFRTHDLPELPHLSEEATEQVLGNSDYWSQE